MGIYRLLLSISVLIFHTSTLLGTIGYSAVFGFYIMSGFAISFVLDRTYRNQINSFWANRLLKIFPAYIAVLVVSMWLYYCFGNDVMINMQNDKLFVAALDQYKFKNIINEITLGYVHTPQRESFAMKDLLLLFNGFPTIVPQAWTNSVEIFFYLTAPFIVSLWNKHRKGYYYILLISIIFPIITMILQLDFPTYRYRCVFSSYYLFLIGSLIYFKKDKLPVIKFNKVIFGLLCVLHISIFAFGENKTTLLEGKIIFSVILEILIIIVSTQIKFNNKQEKLYSVLSIGIYLSHNLSRAVLLVILGNTDNIYIENIIGYGTIRFVISTLILSILFALLLYVFVDRQINKYRCAIRNNFMSV